MIRAIARLFLRAINSIQSCGSSIALAGIVIVGLQSAAANAQLSQASLWSWYLSNFAWGDRF